METQVQDAKAGDQPGETPSNSQLDPEHFDPDSENLIDTVEDVGGVDITTGGAGDAKEGTDPKAGADDGKAESEVSDEDAGKEKLEAGKADDEVPEEFHKHPAWQRVMRERDEAKGAANLLTERVKALETTSPQKAESEKESTKLVDIGNLTTEELLEWQNDDPKGYMQNLLSFATKDIKESLRTEFAQKAQEEKVDATFDAYAKENPKDKGGNGFVQMWDSGQLKTFMDANPGHNAISAHMALTAKSRTDLAVEEAVAKTKKEMTKQQQARVVTDGLGGAPGYSPSTEDQGLKDTKKRGGKISVLADRLLKRRQQQ